MQENLLRNHNFPGLLRYDYRENGYFEKYQFKFMPSLRPNVHFFLDFKNTQEVGTVDLPDWITNTRNDE